MEELQGSLHSRTIRYADKLRAVACALESHTQRDKSHDAEALDVALAQFFNLLPAHKRLKFSEDARRTIHQFATDHRLAYPISSYGIERLCGHERQIAQCLIDFCAHSNGQYVLYTAGLNCVSKSYSREDGAYDHQAVYEVTLESPWIKHDGGRKFMFPSTPVDYLTELAPPGFLETLEYEDERASNDEMDSDDEDDGNREERKEHEDHEKDSIRQKTRRGRLCLIRQHYTYALVVQPTPLEEAMWADLPVKEAVAVLKDLVRSSHVRATSFARRVILNQPGWSNTHIAFAPFLKIVITIDDVSLFGDLLQSVSTFSFEPIALTKAVLHFGWTASLPVLERVMRSIGFSSRVNMVCSVLQSSADQIHIDELIEVLTRFHPWGKASELEADALDTVVLHDQPGVLALTRLFALAHRSSTAITRMFRPDFTPNGYSCHLLIPALVRFAHELPLHDRKLLLPLLRSLHEEIGSFLHEQKDSAESRETTENIQHTPSMDNRSTTAMIAAASRCFDSLASLIE